MTVVRLADVALINPPKDAIAADDPVSFVGMAELSADTARAVPLATRPFREVAKGYTVFRNGDILAAKITPCWENGKVGQADLHHPVGVGSTEFHVIRPSDGLDDRYLLHFLRQARVRVAGELRMTGSGGQRRVPASFLSELELPLPPVTEQRRIAAILDRADAIRTKRRQVLAHLDSLTQSIFRDMFGDPANAVSQAVFGTVAALSGGRNLVAEDSTTDSPYRVLKISSVTSGHFRASETKPLPPGYVPPDRHLVRPGDLLMSRANTAELVGAVAYVSATPGNLALPDKVWRFEWKVEAEPAYYHALFRSSAIRRRISLLASGTGGSMKNVSKAKLEAMPIPIAPLSAQRNFAAQSSAVDAESSRVRVALAADDELFASLQSRGFRGEL